LATARGPRGAPAPADFRVGRGAVLQGRAADLGLAVASRRRLQGRGCFSQNCVTTPASAGAGSSRRARRERVFAKCATTRGAVARECALGQVPRGCARCNSPAPAWWRLRPGWVFGAAHPHPGRCATRPLPHAGEVNMAAWRVRPGGPAAEGAARGSRVRGQGFSAPRWMRGWAGVVRRVASGTRWCSEPMKSLL